MDYRYDEMQQQQQFLFYSARQLGQYVRQRVIDNHQRSTFAFVLIEPTLYSTSCKNSVQPQVRFKEQRGPVRAALVVQVGFPACGVGAAEGAHLVQPETITVYLRSQTPKTQALACFIFCC